MRTPRGMRARPCGDVFAIASDVPAGTPLRLLRLLRRAGRDRVITKQADPVCGMSVRRRRDVHGANRGEIEIVAAKHLYRRGMTGARRKELSPDAYQAALVLNSWWRASLLVLALAGLGSGGVAVFVTKLEAGPVALLASGLVLLLVSASGRLPTRLKVGDSELAWDAVEGFVSRVANEVPDEQAPLLVEALADLARSAPVAAASG